MLAQAESDSTPGVTDTTTFDHLDVLNQAPGVPDQSIYAGFENNENVSLFNGNLLVTHAATPSYPLDGGGSIGLARVYNSDSVRKYRVRFENNELNQKVMKDLIAGRSWVGMGWKMHLGRVFEKSVFSDPDWDYHHRDLYFEDPQGTEYKIPGRYAKPILRVEHIAESGYWDCPLGHPCPSYCDEHPEYPQCDVCDPDCTRIVDPAHYEVTLSDGTTYRLDRIVDDEIVSRGWIKNQDRSGWYTTRITDVHGNVTEVAYWGEDNPSYPEAIKEVRVRRHPETAFTVVITTEVWTTADSGDADYEPSALGMLRMLRVKGFEGVDAEYKYVYDGREVTDGLDGTQIVPVLVEVELPSGPDLVTGSIRYDYSPERPYGPPTEPGIGPLLFQIEYPLGGATRYAHGGFDCGSREAKIEGYTLARKCLGVVSRTLFPEGLGASGDGSNMPSATWRWNRHFSAEHCTAEVGWGVIENRFDVVGPDGLTTRSSFFGDPCGFDVGFATGYVADEVALAADSTTRLRTTEHQYDWISLYPETDIASKVLTRSTETIYHDDEGLCFAGDGEAGDTGTKRQGVYRAERTADHDWRLTYATGDYVEFDGGAPLVRKSYVHFLDEGSAAQCLIDQNIRHRYDYAFVEHGSGPNRRYEVTFDLLDEVGTCSGQIRSIRAQDEWQEAVVDIANLPGSVQPNASGDASDLVSTLEYTAQGNVARAQYTGGDANVDGQRQSYTVDFAWRQGLAESLQIVGVDFPTARLAPDPYGFVASTTDPNDRTTTYDYDALGRLTAIEPHDATEHGTRVVYPDLRRIRVIRSDGSETDFQPANDAQIYSEIVFDALGRVASRWKALPDGELARQEVRYDQRSREIFSSVWMRDSEFLGAAKIDWSADGDGDGTEEYWVRDIPVSADGRPLGTVTFYGRPSALPGQGGNPLRAVPDGLGRVRRVSGADGAVVDTRYCGPHREVTLRGKDLNADGSIDELLDVDDDGVAAESITTRYYNDGFGRLAVVDAPGSSADAAYWYDARGKLAEVRLFGPGELPADPFEAWRHGPSGGLLPAASQARSSSFDAVGRQRWTENPENGRTEMLAYDVWGNALAFRDQLGLDRGYFFTTTYDAAGRPTVTERRLGELGSPAPGRDLLGSDGTFESGVGSAWTEGRLTEDFNFVTCDPPGDPQCTTVDTLWHHVDYSSLGFLDAPAPESDGGGLYFGNTDDAGRYSDAPAAAQAMRIRVAGVRKDDVLTFSYWRQVRESATLGQGDRDALRVFVDLDGDGSALLHKRLAFELSEAQASFRRWRRSPAVRVGDLYDTTLWPEGAEKSIDLYIVFEKGDTADPGAGHGVLIDEVRLGRDAVELLSERFYDESHCASPVGRPECSDTQTPADLALGQLTTLRSYQDGKLISEREFVYRGLNGRVSGVRERLDWTGHGGATGWDEWLQTVTYDSFGNAAVLSPPFRPQVENTRPYEYSYRRGALEGVLDLVSQQPYLAAASGSPVSYDAAGAPVQIGFGNGTQSTIPRDALSRPLEIGVAGPTGASLWNTGNYSYNAAGWITAIGDQEFRYDAAGQLVRAKVFAQASDPTKAIGDEIAYTYDPFGNMLSRTMVDPSGFVPKGFDFESAFQSGSKTWSENKNQARDAETTYDGNGNQVRFRGSAGTQAGALWDDRNRMRVYYQGDPQAGDTSDPGTPSEHYAYDASGHRVLRLSRTGEPQLSLRGGSGSTLAIYTIRSGATEPALASDLVHGLGQVLVERVPAGTTVTMHADATLHASGAYHLQVESFAGYSHFTVDIRTNSGFHNTLSGVQVDSAGRFSIDESELSPHETNFVRIKGEGESESLYSPAVALSYDPDVTTSSANPVRAIAASRTGTDIVVRWAVSDDEGERFRLYFENMQTGTVATLTPLPLAAGTRSYSIGAQSLSLDCIRFYLSAVVGATESPLSNPVDGPASSLTIGVGASLCGPGGGDPPDPPPADPFVAHYQHRDHLGNLRLVTDEAGNVREAHDYYPFGMELESSYGPSRWLFTGHERDKETGLDYMLARYAGSTIARFLAVDPAIGSVSAGAPVTWNRYSYVFNHPTGLRDPSGAYPRAPRPPNGDTLRSSQWGRDTGHNELEDNGGEGTLPDTLLEDLCIDVECGGPGGTSTLSRSKQSRSTNSPFSAAIPKSASIGGTASDNEKERRAYLELCATALSEEVAAGRMTSLEALAVLFEVAVTFNTSSEEMLSDIGSVLSRSTVGAPLPSREGERPAEFTSSGFRSEYDDGSNQVRHAVGAMILGATVGWEWGQVLNTGREARDYLTIEGAPTWGDVRVGNDAAVLGWLISVGAVPRQEVGHAVRRWFGE